MVTTLEKIVFVRGSAQTQNCSLSVVRLEMLYLITFLLTSLTFHSLLCSLASSHLWFGSVSWISTVKIPTFRVDSGAYLISQISPTYQNLVDSTQMKLFVLRAIENCRPPLNAIFQVILSRQGMRLKKQLETAKTPQMTMLQSLCGIKIRRLRNSK